MSHRFDRTKRDPYVESAHQVERHASVGRVAIDADSQEGLFDVLSNAIVNALGDVAAVAYRHGIDDPDRLKGLAKAISAASEHVLASYRGEVDPETALSAIAGDSRLERLPEEAQRALHREVERTRQLEHLILDARRLPDLIDYADSLGLHVDDAVLDQGTVLVGSRQTPNEDQK